MIIISCEKEEKSWEQTSTKICITSFITKVQVQKKIKNKL